jgi:hypothetical protein
MNEAAESGGAPPSTYAVLRRGGVSPGKARALMALEGRAADRLEAQFRTRAATGGGEEVQPRFARHEAHVAAVLAAGGFPSLTERRGAGGGQRLGLPVIWPQRESGR